ncbi:MAG TPA: DNA polymerase IV [Candidatus Anaerofilum excrementigallinarum]|nr:DNA polymerase IV [Candidatus Anaerofilum excrementigallinarum]
MDRWVLHCDCNSFYASVELLDHPHLRDKPVAVCGDPESRHGIILAKNEAAKAFGVTTAETVWQALRKCPDLVLLAPSRKKYLHYSKIINTIYNEYTDLVEPFGIDESWLDVSGSYSLFAPSPRALAHLLRQRIKEETGLTISVGVSFNKVFAKLGSDYKKPDAVTVISRLNYRQLVWPMPASALLYVGRRVQDQLHQLGIDTIGQLAAADPAVLESSLGKLGGELSRYARGEDNSPVRPAGQAEPVKSVGNGMTFRRNLVGRQDVRAAVTALADEVAGRLRRHGLYAGGVQLTIRSPALATITRQKKLPFSTQLGQELAAACMELASANWDFSLPIRMLTVTAQSLTTEPFAVQLSFTEEAPASNPRRARLEQSMDAIRRKYGPGAIGAASRVGNDLGLDPLEMDADTSMQTLPLEEDEYKEE